MKILALICLVCCVAAIKIPTEKQIADNGTILLESFMKTVKGKDYKLSSDCGGYVLQLNLESFKQSVINNELEMLPILVNILVEHFTIKCPLKEIISLGEEIKNKLADGSLVIHFISNTKTILKVLKDFKNSQFSASDFGINFGKIVNIALKGKVESG